MRSKISLLAVPLLLAIAPAHSGTISGSMGLAENSCVETIFGTFLQSNCSFSGGANVSSAAGKVWVGPLDGGGFYANAAAAPAFVLSTQTGVDDNGIPLTSFFVNVGPSAGDGKSAPSVSGNLSIAGSTLSGTITIGAGTRLASTGGSLAGSKAVVESFTSVVHTIVPKAADSVVGGNAFGGSDYIFGAMGMPALQTTALDAFASESAFNSGLCGATCPVGISPWEIVNGGSGKNGVDGAPAGSTYQDIVSFDTGAFAGFFDNTVANVGVSTTAVYNAAGCLDTGLDPQEAGEPVDVLTDCQDSSVSWNVPGNAAFDNMVMTVQTDGGGNVVAMQSYYTNEYNIAVGQTGNNAWQGGYFTMAAPIPVPAAVWLFGSALGLLGWMRRRAIV